jgi:membrane fusion protein, multidrug efflux system
MKTKIISILIAVLVLSCGKTDKQAELTKLKKQHDQISDQIKKLENEIADSESSKNKNVGVRVAVEALQTGTFNHFIEVQGKVDGDENVSVSCQTVGIVEKIYIREGDEVSKDQILAKLDDKILQQTLKELQSSYEFVNSMYEKQKALWDQKIGSEVQYLTAKNNKESLESKIATLKDQIALSTITSPITGTVEDMPIKVGQIMSPGIVAFRVVNFAKVKITADLAEAYTSRINDGDMVSVFLPDLNKEVIGKVDFSSKYINPTNRTFSINVRLKDVDPKLKANMIAVLKINDYKADNAISLPINLVQTDQNGTYVAIAEKNETGSVVKRVSVVTGIIYKGLIEIKSGLKKGEMVITAGYLELENGQTINY